MRSEACLRPDSQLVAFVASRDGAGGGNGPDYCLCLQVTVGRCYLSWGRTSEISRVLSYSALVGVVVGVVSANHSGDASAGVRVATRSLKKM
jgi:hypothetical protein